MWKEILHLKPSIDPNDLNNTERKLNQRFSNVAKKFGKGVLAALLGGGVVGTVLGIANKLLNPLQEVQEAIERALKAADDISTNAKQFGTSSGTLARLQAFAGSAGLDPQGLAVLIEKFQSSVAQAAANPDQASSVSAFVGRKDMAEAFFEFVQSVQKLPDELSKSLVQQEVFGERQILKASEFMKMNFKELDADMRRRGLPEGNVLTNAIEPTAGLSDLKDRLTQIRLAKDFVSKSRVIGGGTVNKLQELEQFKTDRENSRIPKIGTLAELQLKIDRVMDKVEKVADKALEVVLLPPKPGSGMFGIDGAKEITEKLNQIEKTRAARGATGKGK